MAHLPSSPARAELSRRAEVAEVMADTLALDLKQLAEADTSESHARLEIALEDVGWTKIVARAQQQFSRAGIERIATLSRVMWRKNPMIRRGVNVRAYYTWAQGVTIRHDHEDVQQLVDATVNDPVNQSTVFGHNARIRLDRTLALDGNIPIVAATSRRTGAVQVRVRPFTEIAEPVRDPDDAAVIRYWPRRWWDSNNQLQEVLHPDILWRPTGIRPSRVNNTKVVWDQPLMMVTADRLEGDTWGVPEVYAALDWARAYKEFLEDWASYVKALARFAWRHKTRTATAARRAAAKHRGDRPPAGATAAGTDVDGLEPVRQSGAHVDADSARPLGLMVAMAFDMPWSILSGDADNSNLATAQTLDRPFELALQSRQRMWGGVQQQLLGWAIEAAVEHGELPGRVERDEWGHTRTVIDDGVAAPVQVDWPALVEHDAEKMADAIKAASDTGRMPPEATTRLLLQLFGVDDVDRHVDDMMDQAAQAETRAQAEAGALAAIEAALAAA